jgi:hypothetical protein
MISQHSHYLVKWRNLCGHVFLSYGQQHNLPNAAFPSTLQRKDPHKVLPW